MYIWFILSTNHVLHVNQVFTQLVGDHTSQLVCFRRFDHVIRWHWNCRLLVRCQPLLIVDAVIRWNFLWQASDALLIFCYKRIRLLHHTRRKPMRVHHMLANTDGQCSNALVEETGNGRVRIGEVGREKIGENHEYSTVTRKQLTRLLNAIV